MAWCQSGDKPSPEPLLTQVTDAHFGTRGRLVNRKPGQNGHYIADNIFPLSFLYENNCISTQFLLKFVDSGPIDNMAKLVRIMAQHRRHAITLSNDVLDLPMMITTDMEW